MHANNIYIKISDSIEIDWKDSAKLAMVPVNEK